MGFCDFPLADKLCAVGDAVDFASDPGKAIGDWMAKSAGELAAAAADLAAEAVNTTTKVDLNAGWFRDNYEMLLPLGLVLLVATFCAQLVRAAIRRDGQALTQAFTGTASGVLFAFCAIALTTVAIEVVDAVSDGLFKAAHLNIESAVRRVVKVSQIGALSGLGWLVPVVTGLGAAIGAFLYWCVMMVRKVGILVMVTLAVFASAGGGWEVARRWRKGWIEATATLVVSKLLMTVIFVLGIAAMGKTEANDGIAALADVMSGIVIMVLVLLCPYAVFKFVHWAADGTDGESIHRAGGAGAQIAKAHAEKAARKAAAAAATAGTGGAAAGAGPAPQGPDAGGGFPGDVAANPTGGGGEGKDGSQGGGTGGSPGGDAVKSGLEKAVQPAPTSVSDDTSGQVGGSPGPGGSGANAASGQGGGWQTTPPTTTPPPQGAPPSSGSRGSAPPPPTGL
ncbi:MULTISPECIES: SCO6881 family protein [Streptomyces]|uniref:ATP-binding protein n=1 Tax=Streptomyces plicatus TaxID=1922 RepID=A0ABW1Y5J2_STRPL|nr:MULTISPECIES: ATP-binding protein [Streptomyces]RIH59439.1 ATP-binding protein [Streptomyces sp. SHP22-7]MBJ6622342.1 ATP-binding protein [Streptomyces sp. DHE17-7]RSS66388.1 ATP-binding protein [Streptomyces sp. WAC06273]GGZ72699.1 ATP-binding protein [Streptomyces plicatus]GHC28277.1 ATP-binding protein [Streptomyces vinaceusdrappus]